MKKLLAYLVIAMLLLSGCSAGGDVRVALIDTGISAEAVSKRKVAEGKNYLDPEGTTDDTFGHGTAVASVILGNSSDVTLVPLVSNAYEHGKMSFVDSDTFGQMIRDAVDVYDCDIINISAGLVLDKKAIREAIAYAEKKGVLVVASAGNDYEENPGQVYFPAAYETVIAVGSLDAKGKEIAEFSQRGSWVNVFAPGEDIKVTTMSGNSAKEKGSSYAAARVTAAAAKYLKKKPGLSPEKLRKLLIEDAKSYDGMANTEAE